MLYPTELRRHDVFIVCLLRSGWCAVWNVHGGYYCTHFFAKCQPEAKEGAVLIAATGKNSVDFTKGQPKLPKIKEDVLAANPRYSLIK